MQIHSFRRLSFVATWCVVVFFVGTTVWAQVVVPWGTRAGAVRQEISATAGPSPYTGPTSFVIGPEGDVYVLDSLGGGVERYGLDGKLVRSYTFPSVTEHDADTIGLDVAVSPAGTVFVLELAERSVLVIDENGVFQRSVTVPLASGGPVILSGLVCEEEGVLVVLNGFDHTLVRFDLTGKLLGRAQSTMAASMVYDRAARRYLGIRSRPMKTHEAFDIVAVRPFSDEKPTVIATIDGPREITHIAVIGVDGQRRVYVEVAGGTAESPRGRRALCYGADGRRIRQFPIPETSRQLSMLRTRAVTGDGRVLAVRIKREGFCVQSFPLQ